ncbi:Altered inheritance of mitochondria protein 18 mitochondrial [Recurvomyces mirabilis]|uniref:Altered inheritance of mitochondria protein 18 mitochondrial n=1 Tax=Recurvomyces mirabilis TaxID=574656 RepID=A0AAE0TQ21_9PEZI|nr:Altered inheritance of mitochondria protein 18 mitochondrial [Recurvomyces mirabilis]KAK5150502.1 Altered inheritance of mitochondria protein 18 mitochondrial [Recurvomyces mirabilis]
MAAPGRQAMRLLSPRIQYLSRPTSITTQIRHASSRYSQPAKRSVATAAEIPVSNTASWSPLESRTSFLEHEEKRQYHLGRMRFAGMGLLLTMGGLAMVLSNLDLDSIEQAEKKRKGIQLDAASEANATFQGKDVHVIGAGDSKRIVASGLGEEIELVETGTSSVPHFPRTIYLPASSSAAAPAVPAASGLVVDTAQPGSVTNPLDASGQEEYTLVGLGIRTVMWIQVYVVGMYVRTTDITTLQAKLVKQVNPTASALIPSEKMSLREKLLDPEQSRAVWGELLQVPGMKTAFRIAPTRNTDFGHLRDGFVSGINTRTSEARKLTQTGETEFDAEDFGRSVQNLKGIFAGGKAPKGSILILKRDERGMMDVLYSPQPEKNGVAMETLGSVADERVSRLLWFGYLAGEKVSSKAAREGVVNGCMEFVERPIGSVETMVH